MVISIVRIFYYNFILIITQKSKVQGKSETKFLKGDVQSISAALQKKKKK